ncbi:MAG: ribosome biogenesis GTPase Der [Acidobacteria bacterium]|nr:ribosome biogenesis GTPase Der [Acidobacteriota bacterium]
MPMHRVVIIGRANVGKSTLFNRLCARRKAIVGREPGITRDRLYGKATWLGRGFEVVDTGGLLPGDADLLPRKILEQAQIAMAEADMILLLVDVRAGVTSLDQELTKLVRRQNKPCLVVANKVDAASLEPLAQQFYELGIGEVFPISAEHGRGVAELAEAIVTNVAAAGAEEARAEPMRVAIVGRPNVGKSTLLNRLLGQERAIVSEIPGTTRDAVDTLVDLAGEAFLFVDTAGIRRRGKSEGLAEKVGVIMARKSLQHAHVALVVLDASEGITKLDSAIAGYAQEAGCSILLVVNKWDTVPASPHAAKDFEDRIRLRMKFLEFAPVLFVSALKGTRVGKILPLLRRAHQARQIRVPTSALNRFFHGKIKERMADLMTGRKLDVPYLTQAGIHPPTFLLFLGTSRKLHFSMERFLVNQLRGEYGFFATPIRIVQKVRGR